jgi:NAD(P)-dependent dehydrogenase (short-subunit alcohol dehydrogenase family)
MLQDLTAVVTGGGGGIGKAIALALARQGASVIVNDLYPDVTQNVVAEIKNEGGQAYAWVHDITKEDTIQSLTETINKTTGKLHILVNNAGGGAAAPKEFLDLSSADWNSMLSLNLNSVFYCCQAAIPLMLESNYGRIINIASTAALRGGGQNAKSSYAAAKAGVIGLTKGIAREFAEKGICAVAVAPCFHETPGVAGWTDAKKQEVLATIPMKAAGDPADLAEIITFIASRRTKFMTGAVITVDGGFAMH